MLSGEIGGDGTNGDGNFCAIFCFAVTVGSIHELVPQHISQIACRLSFAKICCMFSCTDTVAQIFDCVLNKR
jgi:hypothetical protein